MVAQGTQTSSLINQLLDKAAEYLSEDEVSAVEESYVFAADAHAGQRRKSGEAFIEHPTNTALYLAKLRLDSTALIAALLHDVVEDTSITLDDISGRFGGDIAKLVDGVTKLTEAEAMQSAEADSSRPGNSAVAAAHAATIRKVMMTMADDSRAVLIKLADRLHNMQTLEAIRETRRMEIAQETMDIYAPLAGRLGIWEIKWQLEDLAFRHIDPETYRAISKMLDAKRQQREEYIDRVVGILEGELRKKGIEAQVTGRAKHIYSIHRKMQEYVKKNRTVNDIYDLFALRVIVDTVEDCYAALRIVHAKWRPLPGQFDDYIANPKDNMYESLHTAVMCEDASPVEVQIRTLEMHRLAEYGVAAHWLYKGGVEVDEAYDRKMKWMRRQLLDWQRDAVGAEEYVEAAKTETLGENIFVFTPRGEVKEMPVGSTPLDFAYRIHSNVGHNCAGAKVNERWVPLNYQLRMSDTVYIRTAEALRGPSRDWLNENLGYLNTSHARSLVRRWFNRQDRGVIIQNGREVFTRDFDRLGWTVSAEEASELMGYESLDDFFAALGSGSLMIREVEEKMTPPGSETEVGRNQKLKVTEYQSAEVLGVGDLVPVMASCCVPSPPDAIIGYLTRGHGISVHRRVCPNVMGESAKDYLVDDVEWGKTKTVYSVFIAIEFRDRVGIIRDVSSTIAGRGGNIGKSGSEVFKNGIGLLVFEVKVESLKQLRRLFGSIERVNGVIKVSNASKDSLQTLRPFDPAP